MKLASFYADGALHIGIVNLETQSVFDLTKAGSGDSRFVAMQALIESGSAGLDGARALLADHGGDAAMSVSLAGLHLAAPVPVPVQMRDFSTFPGHVMGAPRGCSVLRREFAVMRPPRQR